MHAEDYSSPDDTQPIRLPKRQFSPYIWLAFAAISCALVLITTVSLGVLLVLANTPSVTLVIGTAEYPITSSARTVQDLLQETGVTLSQGDEIAPPLNTPLINSMIIRITPAHDVILTVDGQIQFLRTTKTNPAEILNEVSLSLNPTDIILIDGTQVHIDDLAVWTLPVRRLDIRRAASISVHDNGVTSAVQSTELTVGDALFAAGVTLYLSDVVSPALNTPLVDGLEVVIQRAVPVTIVADGVTLETRTHGTTVADALAQAGVILVGLDYTIPSEDSALQPGTRVRVIRVTEEVLTQQETLTFDTIFQADSTLELDQQNVTQVGQAGLRQISTRVRYENGAEISRTVEADTIVREPVNGVISYGTNIVVRSLDTPDGMIQYWRVLRLYATSYHPAALGGDDVTATGRLLQRGVVGVDTDIIPFDTQLYIPDYGTAIAADTGPNRSSPFWIDLGYSDADWVSWSRYVDVYFLLPVPPDVVYLLPDWRPLRGTSP